MTAQEPQYFLITESELSKVAEVLRDEGCGQYSKILSQTIRSRPYSSGTDANTKQCETCRLAELRTCMYHGYPKDTIPPSCEYKIGTHAEEAQRNLGSGTDAGKVLDELPNISSTDLLLISHDEWKRREERRRIHEELPWVYGWISGFLTSRKFVHEQLKKLRQGKQP